MSESDEHLGSDGMASAQDMAARAQIAERVVAALRLAWLPAYIASHQTEGQIGAAVTFDKMHATEGGGVAIDWQTDRRLVLALLGFDSDTELDEADFPERQIRARTPAAMQAAQHHIAIGQHMQSAIIGILEAAGLRAYDAQNHYGPGEVAVESP
jgi:hypothetical protein